MIKELIKAFMLVFAAEMGDKTQIIAMTFATQYMVKEVISGVALGVIFNHGLAIILGRYLSTLVPMDFIQIIAGFMFVIFGIMALKDEDMDKLEEDKGMSPVLTVALAFFIGELGDKTQLTAMTLSTEGNYPLFILMGTTLAMMATSSLGIFVGSKIGDKIPEVFIKIASSFVFLFFGIFKLFNVLPKEYLSVLNVSIFLLTISLVEILLIKKLIKVKAIEGTQSPLKVAAARLYKQTETLKQSLDSICLGEDKCGTCSGKACLIGYIRLILKEARENENYYKHFNMDVDKFIKKDYDKDTVMESLALVIADYEKYGWENDEDFIINKIKKSLEYILFGKSIDNILEPKEYIDKVKKQDKILGEQLDKKVSYYLRSVH